MITLEHLDTSDKIKDAIYRDDIDKELLKHIPLENIQAIWFKVFVDHNPIGLFAIEEVSPKEIGIHGGVYKEHRGKACEFFKQCMNIVRQHGIEFVTTVDKHNPRAIKFLQKSGFKIEKELNSDILFMREVIE